MTIKQVENDIRELAEIAILEDWSDRQLRESCTVSYENYQCFLPRKFALLKKVIRSMKLGSSSEDVSYL